MIIMFRSYIAHICISHPNGVSMRSIQNKTTFTFCMYMIVVHFVVYSFYLPQFAIILFNLNIVFPSMVDYFT